MVLGAAFSSSAKSDKKILVSVILVSGSLPLAQQQVLSFLQKCVRFHVKCSLIA